MNLSYSSLSMMKPDGGCHRCFYLDRKLKLSRPEGIKSGMPGQVDLIIKDQMDKFRGALPACLSGYEQTKGFVLYNNPELKKMRHWASNPLTIDLGNDHKVIGAFDDILYNPTSKQFAYLDFKTTGKEPDQAFGEKYYQGQCDLYTHMVLSAKRLTANFGVLLFFWPVPSSAGLVEFKSKAFFLKPNPAGAAKIIKEALLMLDSDDIPPPTVGCNYCDYLAKIDKLKIESCG